MALATEDWQSQLLSWYDAHKRDLPWRRTLQPYAIWVSEIMCQQTQVGTVIPYYERWMQRFPTVAVLAAADEQDVLSTWEGLGYYRRARMLQAGARFVVEQGLPSTAAEWLAVPGVGRYTAGAIASISLQEATPVVDGNVERVFARLEAFGEAGTALNRAAWSWAGSRVSAQRPGDWNQALMELGATICKPQSPLCGACPLADRCRARELGVQATLPVKEERRESVTLLRKAYVHTCGDRIAVEQIRAGEWWAGMWRFLESPLPGEQTALPSISHTVTHHKITIECWHIEVAVPTSHATWMTLQELEKTPMPAPYRRILQRYSSALGSNVDQTAAAV